MHHSVELLPGNDTGPFREIHSQLVRRYHGKIKTWLFPAVARHVSYYSHTIMPDWVMVCFYGWARCAILITLSICPQQVLQSCQISQPCSKSGFLNSNSNTAGKQISSCNRNLFVGCNTRSLQILLRHSVARLITVCINRCELCA